MTTAAPIEDLLRDVLDRLTRQERKSEAIEATLQRLAAQPGGGPARPHFSNGSAPTISAAETPPEIPWPRRTPREAAYPPDRAGELEEKLRQAEERLRLAARLEIAGRLVAGVSHDFNNLLTIISGHADVIRTELPLEHPLRETAELISTTAHTAAGVTRQLVSFCRTERPDPCPVDVNAAARSMERMLGRLTGGRVTLSMTFATTTPLIQIDPGQFDQVLMNLVVNARDAIRDAGTITVRTAAATVASGRPGWPADVPPGEFVVLTVSDSGVGMTEEVKARIFDLFFTTKGDQGTGVGLATVKDIVRSSGGHIEVESAPNWGTSVRVFWPVLPEPNRGLRISRA